MALFVSGSMAYTIRSDLEQSSNSKPSPWRRGPIASTITLAPGIWSWTWRSRILRYTQMKLCILYFTLYKYYMCKYIHKHFIHLKKKTEKDELQKVKSRFKQFLMPKSNMTATKIKYSNLAVIIPLGSSLSLHIGLWQSKALIILFRKGKIHTSNYSQ